MLDQTNIISEERSAKEIWNNGKISVFLRRGNSQPIRLRLPYAKDNRAWLKTSDRKKEPEWIGSEKYWELPASRFNELIKMTLERFGKLYIIQPYREKEVCSPSCMNAVGFECQCSCMGVNHGNQSSTGWFIVSDAFAVRWNRDTKLACRLLIKKI